MRQQLWVALGEHPGPPRPAPEHLGTCLEPRLDKVCVMGFHNLHSSELA